METTETRKAALITGGTGGLGLTTAKHLIAQGWTVFVADCNEVALKALENKSQAIPVFMDVTQKESVEKAFEQVKQQTVYLDAIINFAGILKIGSMAEMDEAMLQRVLNINVMGTFRVNKIFLPLINNQRQAKGRIINISSETGWQSGGPFNGAYAMSKHAIEAYSDSLRRELMFLNIPVVKIQPGPFKTDMTASIEKNFADAAEASYFFSEHLTRIKSLAMKEQDKAHAPQVLADVIYKALTVPSPKPAYSVRPDPLRALLEFFPVHWVDALLKRVLS